MVEEVGQTEGGQDPRIAATDFAPAGRAGEAELACGVEAVAASPLFRALIEAVDGYLLVLNPQRQILAVNQRVLDDLGHDGPELLVGMRPGEAFHCIHAAVGPDGCGSSRFCSTCGAVISVLRSQASGQVAVGECLLTLRPHHHLEATELRVRTTPVALDGERLLVVVLNDVSAEKRRAVLERVFFHDVLNTLGGLMGWSRMLGKLEGPAQKDAAVRIAQLTAALTREVEDQRLLLQAERGDLNPERKPVAVAELLEGLQAVFAGHEVATDRRLEVESPPPGLEITTDPVLVLRVLTNMVKNALEAVPTGATVRVWHEMVDERGRFCVANPGRMPEEVVLRLFQRSFSTKAGGGRGLGTYSMKLFGERYLGGEVGFETGDREGTLFWLWLPASGGRCRDG